MRYGGSSFAKLRNHTFYHIITVEGSDFMKTPKYHIYLTNEERSEVLKSLIDFKNALIEQGKYTDVIDETIIKLSYARKKNIKVIYI